MTVYSSAAPHSIERAIAAQIGPQVTGPFGRWTAARLGIAVVAVAYVGYLALLVTCDLQRVAPLGFVPQFERDGVIVSQLQSGSIGARAGLRAGDFIRRANGQVLEGRTDWQRVRAHLDPSKPFELEVERAGRSFSASLSLPSGLSEWRSGPARPALLAFRLAQIITLALALVVAFKRDSEPSALLGALFLASFATLSLALPMRMAAFWNALPPASRRPPVVAIRDERRRRTAAVCLLRGVPAPLLVDDQTRRRDPPGGNHRLLARVRLVSHHAESRTADRAAGLDGDQRHLRRTGSGAAGGAQAGGRNADGPAPHPRADCGGGRRRGCRNGGSRWLLAQSGG